MLNVTLATSCHWSEGKTPYYRVGVLSKINGRNMACKNEWLLQAFAWEASINGVQGSPFDHVNTSENPAILWRENGGEGSGTYLFWMTYTFPQFNSSFVLSFQDSQRKIHEKDKCLKKSVFLGETGSVTKCNSAHQSIWVEQTAWSPWFVAALAHLLPSASKAGLAVEGSLERRHLWFIYLAVPGWVAALWDHSFPVPCGLFSGSTMGSISLTRDVNMGPQSWEWGV